MCWRLGEEGRFLDGGGRAWVGRRVSEVVDDKEEDGDPERPFTGVPRVAHEADARQAVRNGVSQTNSVCCVGSCGSSDSLELGTFAFTVTTEHSRDTYDNSVSLGEG